jgi:hypothetical protein
MLGVGMVAGCSIDESLRPQPRRPAGDASAGATAGDAAPALQLTDWASLSDDSLWAHITAARRVADVGLRLPGARTGMHRGRVLINLAQRGTARRIVQRIPGVRLLSADTLLPLVKVRLDDRVALTALRALPNVEYVEPGAFTPLAGRRGLRFHDIELGCSAEPYGGPGNNGYIYPGDVVPWNFRVMMIDSIWNRTSGQGVMIGLVDTGIDAGQHELNGNFSSGLSTGRQILKDATRPDFGASVPWHDDCGHGTRMASVIAAPRNIIGTLGVAWGADLFTVKVDDDVFLTEVEATRMGIRLAAKWTKIITMAFGTFAHYSSIAQEISYWYYNKDRLFVAAAGTTTCWDPWHAVTFPGTLETVTAVTAFDAGGGVSCNAARGWEVDFAAYTNQPVHGHSSLGMTLAGLAGSSGATAVIAGMAGLYQALNPGASRDQILSALITAASPNGGRSPLWGFGAPNGLCLVKEMCTAWIDGPNLIQQSGTYTWTARQAASPGPMSYQWSSGETTQSITRSVTVYPGMPESPFTLGLTVRDARNGRTRTDSKLVMVRDPYECPTCY